jgi:hypothetical protein
MTNDLAKLREREAIFRRRACAGGTPFADPRPFKQSPTINYGVR